VCVCARARAYVRVRVCVNARVIKKGERKKYELCLAKSLIRALSTLLSFRVSLPRNNIIITNN